MSEWTHNMCRKCWNERHPNRRPATLVGLLESEMMSTCCFCGARNQDGIYVRADPKDVSFCLRNLKEEDK